MLNIATESHQKTSKIILIFLVLTKWVTLSIFDL